MEDDELNKNKTISGSLWSTFFCQRFFNIFRFFYSLLYLSSKQEVDFVLSDCHNLDVEVNRKSSRI